MNPTGGPKKPPRTDVRLRSILKKNSSESLSFEGSSSSGTGNQSPVSCKMVGQSYRVAAFSDSVTSCETKGAENSHISDSRINDGSKPGNKASAEGVRWNVDSARIRFHPIPPSLDGVLSEHIEKRQLEKKGASGGFTSNVKMRVSNMLNRPKKTQVQELTRNFEASGGGGVTIGARTKQEKESLTASCSVVSDIHRSAAKTDAMEASFLALKTQSATLGVNVNSLDLHAGANQSWASKLLRLRRRKWDGVGTGWEEGAPVQTKKIGLGAFLRKLM